MTKSITRRIALLLALSILFVSSACATAVLSVSPSATSAPITYEYEDTFKVAGVTFPNDDGTRRQTILQYAYEEYGAFADCEGSLLQYEWEGEPAFYVLLDGRIIGNIPAKNVQEVLDMLPDIKACIVRVGCWTPDDGELTYFARITICR